MATRCYIAKQVGPDKFRTVFCHFDGYLEYVGAILAEHYDTEEKLDRLLDVGDIDILYPQLDPDPDRPHSQENPQENVTRAYGRDYGDPDSEAKMKSLRELDDDEGWIEYVYVFTAGGQWKYFHNGQSQEGMHDLRSALANLEMEDPTMDQPDEEEPFLEITEGESNMIKLTLRWEERYTDIDLPCGDEYLAKRLAKLEVPGDLPTNAYVLSVSSPRELSCLEDKILDLDEVNFLARRLDDFDANERKQFYAALQYEHMCSVKDMINLTYNLPRYTVVQDLSSMTAVGRTHLLNLNGYLTSEQQQSIDFASIGLGLVQANNGVITRYGLLFKNDSVPFREVYDGRNFPFDAYRSYMVAAEMKYQDKTEYVYLPCDDMAILKATMRLGAEQGELEVTLHDFSYDCREWYDRLKTILTKEDIFAVNAVAGVLEDCELDLEDLESIMQYAGREDSEAIVALAEHVEDFIIAPGVYDDNEVAEYFLYEVYDCDLPEELEQYLDMCDFGEYLMKKHGGKFVEDGFVCMISGCSLEQILAEDGQNAAQEMHL